jgi:hypothetical protein
MSGRGNPELAEGQAAGHTFFWFCFLCVSKENEQKNILLSRELSN